MSTRSSALLRHVALLALPFTLAACSASTTASAGGTDAPAKAASSPADPDAGLLKGGQLKKALLSAAVLPKGYSAVKDGTLDTGDSFQDASNGPTGTCESLRSSAWIQVTGVGSVAFAQADFMNSRQEEFNEEADTFRGGAAQTAMADLAKAFTRCALFTDTGGGVTARIKLTMTKVPGVGDETIKAVMTSPQLEGGDTMVATRVGNTVITTFYNVQSSDRGAAGLKLTEKIAANVKAAQAGTGA